MKYYLAYGSNLNKVQMSHRCPDAVPIGKTRIPNYELVFRRGVLTIEPKQGSSVPVGVWEISNEDERHLDRYEGYPRFYFKQSFVLQITVVHYTEMGGWKLDGYPVAMAYIMTPGHQISGPSDSYFRTVVDGYHDFGFTEADRKLLWKAYAKSRKGEFQ